MELLRVKTSEMGSDLMLNGKKLNVSDLSKYYGVPEAFANFDKQHKTASFAYALMSTNPSINLALLDNGEYQVMDPKSQFVTDLEFDRLVDHVATQTHVAPKFQEAGLAKKAILTFPQVDTDKFFDDLYQKQLVLSRRPEGGLQVSTNLLRLACTNGMMMVDKSLAKNFRKPILDVNSLNYYIDSCRALSIDSALSSVLMVNGRMIDASLLDVVSMNNLFKKMMGNDVEDIYPIDRITDFYQTHGVDIPSLSRVNLNKLPSGMSYYQAVNVLTHAAKRVDNISTANEIEIGQFLSPSRLRGKRNVELAYSEIPQFSDKELKMWMGDVQMN